MGISHTGAERGDGDPSLDEILAGPCCACRQTVPHLRTVVCLPFHAPPVHGVRHIGGWGCAVCRLPAEGAVAFVCDPCIDAGREIQDYVAGDPRDGRRSPVAELTEPWAHDMRQHDPWDVTAAEGRDGP